MRAEPKQLEFKITCTACGYRPRRAPGQSWCNYCHNQANQMIRQRDPMEAAKSMAFWIARALNAADSAQQREFIERADEARQNFITHTREKPNAT